MAFFPAALMRRVVSSLVLVSVVSLLVLSGLVTVGHAQPAAPQPFTAEFATQEKIYHDRLPEYVEGYVTDRTLKDYAGALPADFLASLAALRPGERWLDIGSGMGQALLDYYSPALDRLLTEDMERRTAKGSAVAMSIEDRRTVFWDQTATRLPAGQLQYWYGRRLREYTPAELGRFRIVTDVVGGFSYTANLSLFMRQVLGALEVGGSFYGVLQDVKLADRPNRPHYADASFLTELQDAAGEPMTVCAWLKQIGCVAVTCETKLRWRPPIESYQVRKVCEDVTVPALEPTHFVAGTPPERGFRLAPPPSTARAPR